MEFMLATLRKRNGVTQASMAEQLGVPLPTYRSWEYGRSMPSLDQLCAIADIFNCTLDELAGRSTSTDEAVLKARLVEIAFAARANANQLDRMISDALTIGRAVPASLVLDPSWALGQPQERKTENDDI